MASLAACGTGRALPGSSAGPSGPLPPVSSSGANDLPTPVPVEYAPLQCPAVIPGAATGKFTVPTRATTPDAATHLVPAAEPTSAVACEYPISQVVGKLAHPYKLSKSHVIKDRPAITNALHLAPKAVNPNQVCTEMAGPVTAYLLGLTYADGTTGWVLQVSDVNNCGRPTNGQFTAHGEITHLLAPAAADGTWGSGSAATACAMPVPGRWGDNTSLVPSTGGDPVSGTWCRADGKEIKVPADKLPPLIAALRATPVTIADTMSQGGPSTPPVLQGALVLTYASGPAVRINIWSDNTPGIIWAQGTAPLSDEVRSILITFASGGGSPDQSTGTTVSGQTVPGGSAGVPGSGGGVPATDPGIPPDEATLDPAR